MGPSGRQGRIGDWRVEIAMPHTCHVVSGVLNLDAGIQCLCDSDYDRTNAKAGDPDTLHTTHILKNQQGVTANSAGFGWRGNGA